MSDEQTAISTLFENKDVIIATITGIATILVSLVGVYANKQKNNAKEATQQLKRQAETFEFSNFIGDWGKFHRDLQELMNDTNLDRFLILRAWNGINDPKWTTAVFQARQGDQEYVSYVHFELDVDYVNRLRIAEKDGFHYFLVKDIPNSYVKDIYEAEGVTASYWAVLDKRVQPDGTALITYCSFATHQESGFDSRTLTKLKILVDRLRAISRLQI